MYNHLKFPRTPDSFTEKVLQVVRENMETTVHEAEKEEIRLRAAPSKKEETILKNLNVRENDIEQRKKNGQGYGWKKKAVAAALTLAVVGAGGFTVHAVVDSMVKARMESMSQEEKIQYVEEVDSAMQENASTYSRELTQAEKERERELNIAYHQDGKFPEGELKRVEDESEVDRDMLCFAPDTCYFYLPERGLTDEELLQIIDYQNKVNYALKERYEEKYAEEIAVQKAAEDETKQKVEADGGITEEEAVVKAQEWLDKLYGKTTEGMELSCVIDTDGSGTKESPVYDIRYSMGDVDSYNFSIGAADGSLREMLYIGKEVLAEEMPASDGEAKAEVLSQTAEKYLRDTFGVSGDCEEVYYSYNKDENDTVLSNMISFRFIMEDGMTYAITLDCASGVLELYKVQDYEGYKKDLETDQELHEKGAMNYEVIRNQLK